MRVTVTLEDGKPYETIVAGVRSDGTFEAPAPGGRWSVFSAAGRLIEE